MELLPWIFWQSVLRLFLHFYLCVYIMYRHLHSSHMVSPEAAVTVELQGSLFLVACGPCLSAMGLLNSLRYLQKPCPLIGYYSLWIVHLGRWERPPWAGWLTFQETALNRVLCPLGSCCLHPAWRSWTQAADRSEAHDITGLCLGWAHPPTLHHVDC